MDPVSHFFLEAWQGLEAPGSVFFWPYLVTYVVVTLAAVWVQGHRGLGAALRAALPRDVYLSRAGRLDLVTSVIYMGLFDVPLRAAEVAVFGAAYGLVHGAAVDWLPALPVDTLAPGVEALLAAAASVMAYDFATYVAHWLSHRYVVFWDLHAVHHSVTRLNPFSIYRDHPVDHLIRNGFRGVFSGTALGLLHAVLPRATWGSSVLGVGLGFFLYLLTVHLHHSPVTIRYPKWLRHVVLSPHMHHIHHSLDPRHHGKNLGVIFPFWDRLFGTYHDEEVTTGSLTYGLGAEDGVRDSLLRCFTYPFLAPFERRKARKAQGPSGPVEESGKRADVEPPRVA